MRHLEDLSLFRRQLRQVLTGASHCLARADEDVANAVMAVCTQVDEIMAAAGTAHDNLASVMAQIEADVLPSLRTEVARGKRHAVVNLLGFAQGWVGAAIRRDLCREYSALLSHLEYLVACTVIVVDYYEQPEIRRQDPSNLAGAACEALDKLNDASGMMRGSSDSWFILYSTRKELLSATDKAQACRFALMEDTRKPPDWSRYTAYCSDLQAICDFYAVWPERTKSEVPNFSPALEDTCSTLSVMSLCTSGHRTASVGA